MLSTLDELDGRLNCARISPIGLGGGDAGDGLVLCGAAVRGGKSATGSELAGAAVDSGELCGAAEPGAMSAAGIGPVGAAADGETSC